MTEYTDADVEFMRNCHYTLVAPRRHHGKERIYVMCCDCALIALFENYDEALECAKEHHRRENGGKALSDRH